MKKILYVVESCDLSEEVFEAVGECQVFYDPEGEEVITVLSYNDAQYRDEYLDVLFDFFGGEIKVATPEVDAVVEAYLLENYA